MADFLEQSKLAKNAKFRSRVQQAALKSALAVMAEDVATSGHDLRVAFAQIVLEEPERTAARIALGVVTNPVITADSSDNDIEFTVSSIWNAYAGVG